MLWRFRSWRSRQPAATGQTPSSAAPTASAEDTFYDVSLRRLDEQLSRNDVLDTKTAGAFSVGSTVLPVTFGLLNLGAIAPPTVAQWLLLGSLLVYGLLLLCSWLSYRLRSLDFRPDLPTLHANSIEYESRALRTWVAEECVRSIVANTDLLARKSRYTGWAIVTLHIEAALLSIAALVTLS